MKKSTLFMTALLVLLALALGACGATPAPTPLPAPTKPPPTPTEAAAAQGDAAAGEKVYNSTCVACHGEGAKGIQGLGKDMTTSEFIAGKTDDELVAFIKVGRDPSDPLNTTGVAMPPKGGNPALDDEDLNNVVAYIRTLQK
jgi:disulfide bond formation protein DsbB